MDEEKLSSLIVDKMADRIGDSLIKVSMVTGILSFGLFLYGKYYYLQKGLKTEKQ